MTLGEINCLIREALASEALQRDFRTLYVVVAQLNASVLAEIELSQIAVQVLAIDVLIDADEATFHDRKEAFKGVHMHVTAHVFALGVIHAFMRRDWREFVVRGLVANEFAVLVDVRPQVTRNAAVIQHDRTGVSAALDKAQDDGVRALTDARLALGLAGVGQRGLACTRFC